MASARKEAVEEEPGYCKAAVLADVFDISVQWIGTLTKDGILTKRQTKAGPRFHIIEATRSYVKYLRGKASGREKNTEALDREKQKAEAEIKLKQAKAEIVEMEVAELKGQLHRSEDVAAMTTDLVYAIRGMLIALPGRLAVDVVHAESSAEAATLIRDEVFKVLDELAEYKYDPAKYAKRVRERQKWADTDEE